tara:strand:+ start:84 stop:470 length:387 start_codon:yes stop_codon:yes gene_type:complete
LESVKQLFQVFTDKILFVEWILQILRAITLRLLKVRAGMEVEVYANTHSKIDLRTAPPMIKNNIIYDEDVLKMRWDLCSSCEFLTEDNRCQKCNCFMAVAHKLKGKYCPVGKWDKYTEKAIHGTYATN